MVNVLKEKDVGKPIQLSEDSLYFPGHANITVLNLGTKSLMIDCGRNIRDAEAIRKEAESVFHNKIEYVVLTHFHSDHTHSLPLFADCQIIASNQLVKFLKAAKRKPPKNFANVYPNVVFEEEYTIKETGFAILVKQTGGHTPDSSHVYSPKHKILAAGDNLRSDFLWGGRKSDPEKWIAALKDYVSLEVETVIIGHGELMTSEDVRDILDHALEVKKMMMELLAESYKDQEIIPKVRKVNPRGRFNVVIHDDTITKWYKFWKKKQRID